MTRLLLCCLLFCLMLQTLAQEVLLRPQRHSYQAGETVYLHLQVNDEPRQLTATKEQVVSLKAYSNLYQSDLLPFVSNSDSVRLDTIQFPGNYTIACLGKNTYKVLPADSFNHILTEHGLAAIIQKRIDARKDSTPGRIVEMACAKTLIRIKSTMKKSDFMKSSFVSYPTGLPLDIVPMDNPYNIKTLTRLTFNVYYQGRLLKDGLAKVRQWVDGKMTLREVPVLKGVMEFDIEPAGQWMISLVRIEPHTADTTADWQSYRGSLNWGYD